MADINPNIKVNIDTTDALSSLRNLQREISRLNKELTASSAANARQAENFQRNLLADINATGKFAARITNIQSSTESFTNALEKNKLSLGEYFKYGAASTKTFGNLFKNEMGVLDKVARERVKTLQTQFISLGRDANGALKAISVRPLRLDLNDLATQTAITAQKQQIFNQLLHQGSTNLLNFGKNTQWAGRQLMVGFTIPLSIFATQAGRTFMELEQQAIRFKRVYGELFTPPEEADQMLSTLNELSLEFTKYGVAVRDTLSLAADAAAMGKTGADLAAQVTEATRLAVLGEVSQQQALETSISLTSAFGYATEELASKIDFLNAVENQTVVSIEDLTIAIPKAAPVIKQLGGGVEELAFFLTAMKEGGINASEGANALKSGFASLINPTTQASDLMMSFGINIRELVRKNAGDAKGLIVEVATALDKLAPAQRAQAIEQMFGKFQFARISTLFQNVVAEGNQASRVLDLMGSSTAELAALSEKELKRVEESTTYRFKGAVEEFQAALAPIGEEFMKLVTPIIEVGTKVLEAFNNMSDGGKQFIIGLTAILGGVAPVVLMTFGLIANGVANLIKGFATVRGFFLGLTTDSKTLGAGIDYMTQQQLEASAAAASLEQKHRNLIQAFTAEKNAVLELGNAYSQTSMKMQGLMAGRPIPTNLGGKAKGYASGGLVRGPGSGTSDSVPIMASNGEFIVNAKRTKQYLPLLQQIAAGTVKGYASVKTGGQVISASGTSYNASVRSGSENAIAALINKLEKLGNSAEDIQKVFDNLESASGAAVKKAAKDAGLTVTGKHGSGAVQMGHLQNDKGVLPSGERVMGSRVRAMIPGQNKAMDTGGQAVDKFSQDWFKMTDGLAETIKLGGAELTDEMRQVAREIDQDIHDIAIQLAKDTNGGIVNDPILAQAADQATLNARAKGGNYATAADALDKTKDMDVIARATTQGLKDSQVVREAGIEFGDETYDQVIRRLKTEGLVDFKENSSGRLDVVTTEKGAGLVHGAAPGARLARENSSGKFVPQGRRAEDKSYLDMPRDVASYVIDSFGQDLKDEAQVKSPSKKTTQAAEGMVDGVTETIRDSKKEVAKATDDMLAPVSGQAAKKVGKRRVTTDPKIIADYEAKKLESLQRTLSQTPAAPGLIADNLSDLNPRIVDAEAAFGKFTSIASKATMGLSAVTGIVSMFGGELGSVTGLLFQFSTVAFGVIQVLEMLPSKVSAALATRLATSLIIPLSDAVGVFGKLKAGFLGILRFLGPVGIGLSLVAAAIPLVVNAYNKQKAQMEAFGRIVDITADKIQYLGDQAGVTVVTDDPFNSMSAVGINQANATAMAESEEFKNLYADNIKGVADATIEDAQLGLQRLSYELLSRGIPDTMVRETISGIIKAAERTDLVFDYRAVSLSEDNKNQLISNIANSVAGLQLAGPDPTTGYVSAADASTNMITSAKVQEAGKSAGDMMSAFGAQFRGSDKTQEDVDALIANFQLLQNTVESLDPSVVEDFMSGIFSNIENEELRGLLSGLSSVDDQMGILTAMQSGLTDDAELTQVLIDLNRDFLVEGPAAALANAEARKKLNDITNVQKNLEIELSNIQRDAALAAIGGIDAQTASVEGQIGAYDNLVAAGMTGALAFKVVGDQALYTAYQEAEAANMLDEFILAMGRFEEAAAELEKRNPVVAGTAEKSDYQKAMEALQGQADAANDTYIAYKRLRKAGFDVATAAKAAQDATLAAALASTKVGSQKWTSLINEINQTNAALERTQELLDAIALSTPEGKTEAFMDGYDKAMEKFAVMEQELQIKFDLETKDAQDKILKAQRDIEDLNYTLDDYEAGITEIELQEDEVNKKYDARVKALDDVSKVNDKIAKQQKAQLTVADALSQGDIAAAARAVQEQRAAEAQDAIESQKNALELQRTSALSKLTSDGGKTRAELEALIAETKQKIFDIEEDTLEPAQRSVELAQRKLDDDTKALKVLGLTKAEWEATKNKIDLARVSSSDYISDMQRALDLVNDIVEAWNSITSKEVTLTVVENRVTSGGSGGSSSSSSSSSSGGSSGSVVGGTAGLFTPGPVIADITEAEKTGTPTEPYRIGPNGVPIINGVPVTSVSNTKTKTTTNTPDVRKLLNSVPISDSKIVSVTAPKKKFLAVGGVVGRSLGSDTVPAMLTPGEFVVRRNAVNSYGLERLKAINSGQNPDGSVYNYNLSVNVKSDANPDEIAQTVMTHIKRVNSQQLRSMR